MLSPIRRRQSGIAYKSRETPLTPLKSYGHLVMGRIVDTHPEHGTVDVALARGGMLYSIPLVGRNGGNTKAGVNSLPQIWNSPIAQPPQNGKLYDEHPPSQVMDTFVYVGFTDSYGSQPVVLGYSAPNSHQLSFAEPNLEVERHVTDVHTLTWADNATDLRPPPFGGGGDPDDPYTALSGNWQLVFPDRYTDVAAEADTPQYNDLYQTFISVGYHETARSMGDGTPEGSANFDSDKHPWTLSPKQKGDKPANRAFARGLWFNQRWRSRLAIDQNGEIELRAEGLDYDSTHFQDKTDSFGKMDLWARLDQRQWSKDFYQWVRMRPRYDGKDPESLITAKQTGSAALRVQRDWDVAVRRQVTHTYVEGFTLEVGDYDCRWDTGPGGHDPGKDWDNTVLNPDFYKSVNDDKIWRGRQQDGYLRGANVSFLWSRPQDSLATGPQSFQWTLDNKQPPQQGETSSDCTWTLLQETAQGNTSWTATQTPSNGSATATWQLTGSNNDAIYTITTTATDPHDATITLTAHALTAVSITLDGKAGTVAISAPNGLFVNGTQVTVP